MTKITNWTAKRSGPRIVIFGKLENGEDIRVGVNEIKGGTGDGLASYAIATARDGETYALV